MPACPYCQFEISEEYNFCLNCDSQVKCTHCAKLLIPGKTRCFVCGNSLVSKELSQTQMNEFTLEEKQTTKSASRRINARLSDDAFGQAASLFGGMPSSRLVPQTKRDTPPSLQKLLPIPEDNQEEVVEQVIEGSHAVDQSTTPSGNDNDKDKALRFFKVNGEDELISKFTDYKGKSKKEQQQRFIIMYVWAYQHIFSRIVSSKEHMNSAAKRVSIYDSNFANYFEHTAKQFLMSSDVGYEINLPGTKRVDEIIKEMDDDGIKGAPYWNLTSKPPRKRTSFSKEDEQKINQWLEIPTSVDKFDVRKLKSAANLAAFAIWIITKQLDKESAVKPREAYSYLKSKYKTIAVKQDAFSCALRQNPNKFAKTQEGLYFLKEEAEREVEAWIQGEPIQETTEPEIRDDEGENDQE